MSQRHWMLVPLLALFALPQPAAGQIRASEPATVSQTVDGTVVTVDYARPRVRGRSPLFGGVVYWGEVWTPGANWATTLELSKDVEINGHPVAAGKYSVWFVVRKEGWSAVLDPKAKRFHLAHPDSTDGQVWFPIATEQRPALEVLTWWFPDVTSTGMELAFQWGETYVPLQVRVAPSRSADVADSVAQVYVGRYRVRSPQAPADAPSSTMELFQADGQLKGHWTPPPYADLEHLVLLPVTQDWFTPALVVNGELFDVPTDIVMEFTVENRRAVSFEVRGPNDEVFSRGVRR